MELYYHDFVTRLLTFRQLFVDGKRQIRARYPNLAPKAERWNGKWAHSKADAAVLESSEPFIVWDEQGAFPRSWAKPSQGELFLMPSSPLWGDSCIIRIKSIDRDKKIIRLVHGTRDFDCNPFFFPNERRGSDVCQFIVENILEELDQPGEWCLDSEEGVLYFWPLEDSIDNTEVVAPVVKCLVHLREVSDVHISGFVFTETKGGEPSSHYSDVEGVGAMRPQMGWEYCGEAIYLNMCKDCYIENNKIFNIGGNGIYLRNHNERNVIRGNEISYAGANGVVLAGSKHNIYQEMLHTKSGTPHPTYTEIADNIIHHVGIYDTYVAGIFLGMSSWNRVVHNEIHDVPHHAINLGNSRYGRNYIEYNRIYRACQVNDDTGAINCWNETPPEVEPPGHVIRYNFISDTGKAGQITMGIYLDNWCSQCIVQGNIIVNTAPDASGYAIFAKGRNNIIENNILINSGTNYIILGANYPEIATIVSKNIMCDTSGQKRPFFALYPFEKGDYEHLWEVLLYSDYNLFFEPGTKNPMMIDGVSLSDWHKKYGREGDGYDTHSIVADPMFVDMANGDYRLRPESPALKLGFQPIDISKIGIRNK